MADPTEPMTISRVCVYVDGFNFYGATKGTEAYPFGWCNWRLTAENYCGLSRRVVNIRFGYRLGADGKHVEPDAAEQAVLDQIRSLRRGLALSIPTAFST